MNLHFILIFVIICVFQNTLAKSVSEAKYKLIEQKCQEKLKASEDDLEVLSKAEWFAKTKTQFCLIACTYKETGFMNKSNHVDADNILDEDLKYLKTENEEVYTKSVTVYKECGDKQKPVEDECEAIENYAKCLSKKAEEVGLDGHDLDELDD